MLKYAVKKRNVSVSIKTFRKYNKTTSEIFMILKNVPLLSQNLETNIYIRDLKKYF